MDPWKPDSELRQKGLDPSRLLSIGEAARLAGVSDGTIRKKVDAGRLLVETGRRGGREIQVVRMGDLALLYPRILDQRGSEPVGAGEPEPVPLPESALSERFSSLEARWEDLRQQCEDLQARLTLSEKERRVSTAALLSAQNRMLQIEGGEERVLLAGPPPSPWRQPTTWFGLGMMVILTGIATFQYLDGNEVRRTLGEQLGDAQVDVRDVREGLAREQEAGRQARAEWTLELEGAQTVAADTQAALAETLLEVEQDRAEFQRQLDAREVAARAAEGRLRDLTERSEEATRTAELLHAELESERRQRALEEDMVATLVPGGSPEPQPEPELPPDTAVSEASAELVNAAGERACSFFAATVSGEELRGILGPCFGKYDEELEAVLGGHLYRGRAYCQHHHFFGRYLSASVEKAREVAAFAIAEGTLPPLLRLRVVRRATEILAEKAPDRVASGMEGGTRDEHELRALGVEDGYALVSWYEAPEGEDGTVRARFEMRLKIDSSRDGDQLLSFEILED